MNQLPHFLNDSDTILPTSLIQHGDCIMMQIREGDYGIKILVLFDEFPSEFEVKSKYKNS